jgi:hypothetical protein
VVLDIDDVTMSRTLPIPGREDSMETDRIEPKHNATTTPVGK